ncbi:hypothetical protein CFAM422_010892 [Trichoderma lentiforme]|uniref:Uncharacterized protein n=1 Tax=Trichoderma lentiforme TaxID=1567552 RepID=A0A9P4X6T3_9HYPO|nr:hypothetical protein CFAM422_010892 [Trichoderma lentiforme]
MLQARLWWWLLATIAFPSQSANHHSLLQPTSTDHVTKLPPINIDDPVSSIQILPTILDLLIETKSLSLSEARAAHDMVQKYEVQSLMRPLQKFSKTTGQ